MRVVHGEAVLVYDIGVDGAVGDATLVRVPRILVGGLVVDGVLGVEQVTAGQALLVARCAVIGGRGNRGAAGLYIDGQNAAACVDLRLLRLVTAFAGASLRLEVARPAGQRTRW